MGITLNILYRIDEDIDKLALLAIHRLPDVIGRYSSFPVVLWLSHSILSCTQVQDKVIISRGTKNWPKHLPIHLMQPNVPIVDWELIIRTDEKGAGELISQILEADIPYEQVLIKSPDAPRGVVMLPYTERLQEALALQSFDAAS